MEDFVGLIGKSGVLILIAGIFFGFSYKNSVKLFEWFEDQTIGNRDYILEKLEFMFIEVNPNYITYFLMFISVGLSALILSIFAFFGMFFAGVVIASLCFFIGWKAPRPIIDIFVEKRILAYQNQMVDGLNLLSNGLKAGQSLPQAFAMVVGELPNPISQEFNLILQQTKIGVPLEECLENLQKRIPTEDNDMFVTSIKILRETGGNLIETFETIVDIIRERVRLKQKIDTYIAQGRVQGIIMFCMPFAMAAIYTASDPNSMKPLVTTPMGWVATILALGLNCLGGFVIMKMIKIKV